MRSRSSPRPRPIRSRTTRNSSVTSPIWPNPGDAMGLGMQPASADRAAPPAAAVAHRPETLAGPKKSAYRAELERVENDIAELGTGAVSAPVDAQRATRYAYSVYQHAVLTGDLVELEAAERVIDAAIRQ